MNNSFVEIIDYLADTVAARILEKMPQEKAVSSVRVKLAGIRGIAGHLGASVATIQKMKNAGVFPVYWVGSRLYAYSDEIEAGIKNRGGR